MRPFSPERPFPKRPFSPRFKKCCCFPCSSIIYRHLMFSALYFKSSLPTISIKSVNACAGPLWDFLPNNFEVVLIIMTIAEIFVLVTTSPGYAGINLTGYPPPRHLGAFAPKCVPSPGPGICISWLSNVKIVNTVIWP